MCWRERFLTLSSSLITYTGKEFVYVIIFSLTASLNAAMIQCCCQPPSPPPRFPVKRAPGTGTRKDAPLLPPGQHQPRTKPGSARKPLCKLCAENTSTGLSSKPPSSGFASYLQQGSSPEPPSILPGRRDHQWHVAPGGTCPASAVRVKLMRNPALGAARPSCPAAAPARPGGEPHRGPQSIRTSRQF